MSQFLLTNWMCRFRFHQPNVFGSWSLILLKISRKDMLGSLCFNIFVKRRKLALFDGYVNRSSSYDCWKASHAANGCRRYIGSRAQMHRAGSIVFLLKILALHQATIIARELLRTRCNLPSSVCSVTIDCQAVCPTRTIVTLAAPRTIMLTQFMSNLF